MTISLGTTGNLRGGKICSIDFQVAFLVLTGNTFQKPYVYLRSGRVHLERISWGLNPLRRSISGKFRINFSLARTLELLVALGNDLVTKAHRSGIEKFLCIIARGRLQKPDCIIPESLSLSAKNLRLCLSTALSRRMLAVRVPGGNPRHFLK